MKIFYSADRIMSDGEIVITGRIYKNDIDPGDVNLAIAGHSETIFCKTAHTHEKACAVALADQQSSDEKGTPIVGTSAREKIAAWFNEWDTLPEDPVHVEMPTKVVQVVEDGKKKGKVVPDRDLGSSDLTVVDAKP